MILGSSVPTALFTLLLYWIPHLSPDTAKVLGTAWLGGSFVGMTNPERFPRPILMVPLAGCLYGALQITFGNYLAGMGGLVGATALITVFTIRGAFGAVDVTRRAVLNRVGDKNPSKRIVPPTATHG